jgi:polar amino acid transport system permease protein
MTGSYSDAAAVEADEGDAGPAVSDRTVRRLGVAASVTVAIAVLAMLTYILAINPRSRIDPDLLVTIVPRFFEAWLLVLGIFLAGSALSVFFGVFVGLGRVSNAKLTTTIASVYVEFFRGTPLLFQLIVIFFGIPALWPPGEFPVTDFAVPAAIIGLTLNHAAYVGEAVRGGINSVPDGQMEAARSLGMSYVQSMREVILPQAWRNALAAIGNDQVILVKDTSLLTVIAVPELISEFRDVNSATFDPWTPILLVAVAYLGITLPLGKTVRWLESRGDWGGDAQ